MILVLLLIAVFLFSRAAAGSEKYYPPSVEKFISLFVVHYAHNTGRVLTRSQAISLIRAVWDLYGERILRETTEEQACRNAQDMVAMVCAEAERNAAEKRKN